MRVLLTGGCGLVGRTLAPLLAANCDLAHFDVADPGDGLPCIVGDLRDARAVEAACRDKDAVVHLAALHGATWAKAGDDAGFEVNVMGTRNILEGALKNGVRHVVFTSSICATGHGPNPPNPPYLPVDEDLPREPVELYGLTKKLGEQMCRYYAVNHGLSALCLRPGYIQPADAPLKRRVSLLCGAVDVRDVARAHVLAIDAPESMPCESFVITARTPLCQAEAADVLADPVGVLERLVPGTGALVDSGRLALPALQEWYTIEKAGRMLGYEPAHNFSIEDYTDEESA
jgi:nucleoside-diphosphate-sugar epimerase